MDFVNNTRLMAAFPMINASTGLPGEIVVMVERLEPVRDRYVTARVAALTDTYWTSGNYFSDDREAMADALERAGWRGVVREHLLV